MGASERLPRTPARNGFGAPRSQLTGLDVDGAADVACAAGSTQPSDVTLVLDGQVCRIVCVDGLLPCQHEQRGSPRARMTYLPNEVAHFQLGEHRYALVVARPDSAATGAADARDDIRALLTNRELQIVQFVCMGLLTKQVADRLRISEFTVRSYLKTIYCKLGVRSRGAMVYTYAQSLARARSAAPGADR